jgi:RNA polymerase-associated protein
LMPVDPVARAQFRVALYRIERDWYGLARQITDQSDKKQGVRARKGLRDSILASTEVFRAKPYFLADEFSLVDATIAPILWRLPAWEIDIPRESQAIEKYANLVFSRPAFRYSLSRIEQEMRP